MTSQRQAFEYFFSKFCGVPYADLALGGATGLDFAWECWQEAQRQTKPQWTARRAFQLTSDLAGLLRECHDLNTASGVISRMERIANLAAHLLIADIANGEPSFLEFLNQLCREDRRNQTNQETK